MALSLVSQPPDFCSAYKDLSVGVTSTKHPTNTTPGESSIAINSIKVADATDVSTFGAPLEVGDLFIYHSVVPLGVLPAGQTVKVTGSNIAGYNGVWRILKEVSDKIKVIACDDFGIAIMGLMEKYYENYTLVVALTNQSSGGALTHYDVLPDEAGVFYVDPSDHIRSTFNDIFEVADVSQPFALIDAETYITQRYSVVFEEAYNIPDSDGVNVYTELGKNGSTVGLGGLVAVNSVQPYHHIEEGGGAPDLLWQDDLDYHEIDDGTGKRWLTYRTTGSDYDERTAQRCGYSDACWLAFLSALDTPSDPGNGGYRVRYQYYQASGSTSTAFANITISKDSYLINVGAEAMGFPSTVVRYSIALYLANTEIIPPTWFTVDEKCYAGTRFYVLNRFGAIDNYTADGGKLIRSTDVDRLVVTKSSMARNLTVGGDYQRRSYATRSVSTFEQSTRKEEISTARWILDELLSSPDVRVQLYDESPYPYTRIIFETDKASAGFRSARFDLAWTQGVDNQRQRR